MNNQPGYPDFCKNTSSLKVQPQGKRRDKVVQIKQIFHGTQNLSFSYLAYRKVQDDKSNMATLKKDNVNTRKSSEIRNINAEVT